VVMAIGRDEVVLESVAVVDADVDVDVWGARRVCGGNGCRGAVVRFGCLECLMPALDAATSVGAPCRGTPSGRAVIAASFAAKEAASEPPGAVSG
jgi:hypothetical protein